MIRKGCRFVLLWPRHATPLHSARSLQVGACGRMKMRTYSVFWADQERERDSDWCQRVADRLEWTLPNPMLICFCIWAVDPPDVYHNNPIDCPPIIQGQMKPIGCGDHVVSVKPWERPFWLWLSYFWNIL